MCRAFAFLGSVVDGSWCGELAAPRRTGRCLGWGAWPRKPTATGPAGIRPSRCGRAGGMRRHPSSTSALDALPIRAASLTSLRSARFQRPSRGERQAAEPRRLAA